MTETFVETRAGQSLQSQALENETISVLLPFSAVREIVEGTPPPRRPARTAPRCGAEANTRDYLNAAIQSGAFSFWADEAEDIYTEDDGEPL